MNKHVLAMATCGLLAVGLGACGSDNNDTPSSSSSSSSTPAGVAVAAGTVSGAGSTFAAPF